MTVLIKIFSLILGLSIGAMALATSPSLNQTKNKLQELDKKISTLKQTLLAANDKRGLLNQELAGTDKQIHQARQQLIRIQGIMSEKEQKILRLQQEVNSLNNQLIAQQRLLAEHVRLRYKMGEYQPLKWIINQDEPYRLSRLFSFHRYFIRSRQQLIQQIDSTKQTLYFHQKKLKEELSQQSQLKQNLKNHQQELGQSKNYHKAVIESLNQEIQSQKVKLDEYQRNKKNLALLLKNLAKESSTKVKQAFSKLRRKLPHPVQIAGQNLEKMNQGLTFFAAEGTPVTAVYPGKVVFSDWLKGYGFLLILDHGQGFMTLYAHNQSLLKPKGVFVAQGEAIAAVGHSGVLKQNGLYFEVRHHGKAVPPLDWLS